MKRILALMAIFTLLITTAVACSKKKTDSNATPTNQVSDSTQDSESSADDTPIKLESIMFGGDFTRDNAHLSFGIADGAWTVSGYYLTDDNASPLLLSGTITSDELPVFTLSEADNELSFTFATDSVIVEVKKGTKYTDFAGSYKRTNGTNNSTDFIAPEHGSTLEFLGRIALAHYVVGAEDSLEIGIDLSASSFDTKYMEKVVLAYTDMFLIYQAEAHPDIFDKYLCYSFTKDEFNRLLQEASFAKFTVDDFQLEKSVFKYQDGNYYVPCYGSNAGGLTIPEAKQELVSDALVINGVVSKANGTRLNVEMTLTTKSSNKGLLDVLVESVNYKYVP